MKTSNIEKMMRVLLLLFVVLAVASCVPKEPAVLRSIEIKQVLPGKEGEPLLLAEAIFYNPNAARMTLKGIDIEVMVDGKKAASVDQKLSALIKGKSEFTVPLEIQLHLKEGLLDTILSLFGGKTYDIMFNGNLKVRVKGFPIKVPVNYKEQIKL